MKSLINIPSGELFWADTVLNIPEDTFIPHGVTVVLGPNGSGKSIFADILERGRNYRTNHLIINAPKPFSVKKVEFDDIHSLRGIASTGYYQQRYEATMNDDVPTVAEIIDPKILTADFNLWCERLELRNAMEKKINFLSSGELRKLLIASALAVHPDLLILDNPYIGLDAQSRKALDDAFARLADSGLNLMLIICDPRDIPPYADAVLPVVNMAVQQPASIKGEDIDAVRRGFKHLFGFAIDFDKLPRPLMTYPEHVEVIAAFNNVPIKFGSTVIIPSVNWTIRSGDCWALNGPNGSGKSTLLSLINADNPAGYSADITLFDRKRGSGESIWDIKRLIGFVSPEMRLYFSGSGTALETVARGLFDTVGNFIKPNREQLTYASLWLKFLHMEDIADTPFTNLSAGEKQLVLLARALVKRPPLLILDEPMHALDYGRKRSLRALINYIIAKDTLAGKPVALIYVTHDPYDMPECINKSLNLDAAQSPIHQ